MLQISDVGHQEHWYFLSRGGSEDTAEHGDDVLTTTLHKGRTPAAVQHVHGSSCKQTVGLGQSRYNKE